LIKIAKTDDSFDQKILNKKIDTEDYTIIIKGKNVGLHEDEMVYSGKIEVTDKKNARVFTSDFYGECAC